MLMELVQGASQFGVAGLMGALWIWERRHSRKREAQLDETHRDLAAGRETLRVLVALVRRNTQTIERFNQTQDRLIHILERIEHDMHHHAA